MTPVNTASAQTTVQMITTPHAASFYCGSRVKLTVQHSSGKYGLGAKLVEKELG